MFFRNRRVFESEEKVDYDKQMDELEARAKEKNMNVDDYFKKFIIDKMPDEQTEVKQEDKSEKTEENGTTVKNEINTL